MAPTKDELEGRLHQALQRVLSSGIWDDPRSDVAEILGAIGVHLPDLAEWGTPTTTASRSSVLAAYLMLALQWTQGLREDLWSRRDEGLDPNDRTARVADVLESFTEAVIWTGPDFRVGGWNKAASQLFEKTAAEVTGQFLPEVLPRVVPRGDLEVDARIIRRGGRSEREVQWTAERWVRVRVNGLRNRSGQEAGYLLVMQDCTNERRERLNLKQLAWSDPLTNLPNRALLMVEVEGWLEKLVRVPKPRFAVVLADLDRFKAVNDTLGHATGDRLLRAAAIRIQQALTKTERLARLGGDEFAILLEGVSDASTALQAAQRIQRCFRTPLVFDSGEEHYASLTMGVAIAEPGMEAEELLRNADIALYTAKIRGPDQLQLFNAALRISVAERAAMDEALRRDVERYLGADPFDPAIPFKVQYQPILSLADDRIDGFEALVRWEWNGALISPVRFVKAAEDSGLIVQIGRWVLLNACRQLKLWKEQFGERGPRSINVNVSVRQLRHPGYVEDVAAIIRENGLEPSAINLEITESSFLEDEDAIRTVIGGLERIGVKLSMDDFGTGYSSFSYLSRLPFSSIKVDRSFVCRITAGEREERLVRSIVHLALDLGMSATAEGVELEEEYLRLKAMRCPRMQGYWLSKPLTAVAATRFLEGRL